MLFSNTSSALSLNPCLNPAFHPPIYTIGSLNVVKAFQWDGGDNDTVSSNFGGSLNFTLSDVANNYSLSCNWGQKKDNDGRPPRGYGSQKSDWGLNNCVDPITGEAPPAASRIATLLNLNLQALLLNKSPQTPVRIAQYWWCDIVNRSFPDPPYQAHADVYLDIVCPQVGSRDSVVACNAIQPPAAAAIKAQWISRGTLFPGTRQLEGRPTTPPQSRGIREPPPSHDCTDLSFSYPDWTIQDLTYKEPVSGSDPAATASFNMSVTHRPTGVRMRCLWGAEIGVTETWAGVVDYTMIPVCKMEGQVDPLNSNSSLHARFNVPHKELALESRWRCGDVAGTYSTNFVTRPAYPTSDEVIGLPLYCSSRICTLDTPFRIDGMLLSPVSYFRPKKYPAPQGSSTSGCLRNSQAIEPGSSPFVITRFLWQATTVTQVQHWGQSASTGLPVPYNRTLVVALKNTAINVETSCAFSDTALDGETDRWWPCFRESGDLHRRPLQRTPETWVQFSAKAGQLRVNQTWYCYSENNGAPSATPYKITGTAMLSKTRGTVGAGRAGFLCGNGTNTVYGVACPLQFFVTADSCDYIYNAQWCTLGDREGYSSNWPSALSPVLTPVQSIDTFRLPPGDLTEPDPTSTPDTWSCTVASLGRGPVQWRLQTRTEWVDFFSLTDWFGWLGRLTSPYMNTIFTFNLASSAFAGMFPPTNSTGGRGDGIIRGVGSEDVEGNGPFLTPGMQTFDPSRVYTNPRLDDWWDPGWKFYNALGWQVRLDISTGYLELNHSWYCDDKNLDTPVIFNGTWNGYLPLDCKWEFPGPRPSGTEREGVVCRLVANNDKKEVVVVPTVTQWVSDKRIPDLIRQ